jgi:hypothetical protein
VSGETIALRGARAWPPGQLCWPPRNTVRARAEASPSRFDPHPKRSVDVCFDYALAERDNQPASRYPSLGPAPGRPPRGRGLSLSAKGGAAGATAAAVPVRKRSSDSRTYDAWDRAPDCPFLNDPRPATNNWQTRWAFGSQALTQNHYNVRAPPAHSYSSTYQFPLRSLTSRRLAPVSKSLQTRISTMVLYSQCSRLIAFPKAIG